MNEKMGAHLVRLCGQTAKRSEGVPKKGKHLGTETEEKKGEKVERMKRQKTKTISTLQFTWAKKELEFAKGGGYSTISPLL